MYDVVFRVDASFKIGSGHVMRCITLAEKLRQNGLRVLFVCRDLSGNLITQTKQKGFDVRVIECIKRDVINSPDEQSSYQKWLGCDWKEDFFSFENNIYDRHCWLVVDHYSLDRKWESAARPYFDNILVIDDLANREHNCDLLLDQTLGRLPEDYIDLIPRNTKQFIGPEYVLLRDEFEHARTKNLHVRENFKLHNILITMGGSDENNITSEVLNSLKNCNGLNLKKITVILGHQAKFLKTFNHISDLNKVPCCIHQGVSNISKFMIESDLVIGAGGMTTWERCALGVPTIQIPIADNQIKITEEVEKTGAILSCLQKNIMTELPILLKNCVSETLLKTMNHKGKDLVDGKGTNRLVKYMLGASL